MAKDKEKKPLTDAQKAKAKKLQEDAKELDLELVTSESLKGFAEKMEQMESNMRELADKGRLQRLDEKNGAKKVKERTVRLTVYNRTSEDGKSLDPIIVVGWQMVVDQVFKNQNGMIVENQIVKLFLEDGKELSVPYVDFVQKQYKINATIKKREVGEPTPVEDPDGFEVILPGEEYFTVLSEQGKEYKLLSKFVN